MSGPIPPSFSFGRPSEKDAEIGSVGQLDGINAKQGNLERYSNAQRRPRTTTTKLVYLKLPFVRLTTSNTKQIYGLPLRGHSFPHSSTTQDSFITASYYIDPQPPSEAPLNNDETPSWVSA